MRRPPRQRSRLFPAIMTASMTVFGGMALVPVTSFGQTAVNPLSATTASSPSPRDSFRSRLEPRRLSPPTESPALTNAAPTVEGSTPVPASTFPDPVLTPEQLGILRLQIDLANRGLSPGSIDAAMGPKTRGALRAFQAQRGLPATGVPDEATLAQLGNPLPTFVDYVVTEGDLARLTPVSESWLAKSQQNRLDYETVPELVGERVQSSPALIMRLNPNIDWQRVLPGVTLKVPNVRPIESEVKAAFIQICLEERILQAYDTRTNLLAQFPCSIGRQVEQRPVGQLRTKVLIPNPNYTFNPEVFPESEEGRRLGRKLVIPPGPNNPVGMVWIGLDRPGYGIHGTPKPEQVGRAESHGCFRLANWNAKHLLRLSWLSMPVYVYERCRR